MKICIIGFPRSRSSILLETISLFYNIPILGEDINQLTLDYKVTPTNMLYQSMLANYRKVTEGVIRFHLAQLLERPRKDLNANFDLFEFSQYDKIYFTFRESVSDIIASEFVAETLNTWTYQSKDAVFKNIEPMEIPADDRVIRDYVTFERAVVKLKTYLTDNNIASEDLFYNDIPLYLKKHFPGANTFHVRTNYDYSKIITNYDSILEFYNQYKNE